MLSLKSFCCTLYVPSEYTFFIINFHIGKSGRCDGPFNIFKNNTLGLFVFGGTLFAPVENSPTTYLWLLYIYSYATQSTSSLFNCWFKEIYPNNGLKENSLVLNCLA